MESAVGYDVHAPPEACQRPSKPFGGRPMPGGRRR